MLIKQRGSLAVVFVAACAVVVSQVGRADGSIKPVSFTQPTTGQVSTTERTEGKSNVLDSLYLNLFSVYHGAPMNNFSSSHQADRNGALSAGAVNLDSELTAAYMFSKDVGVGPSVPFLLVPVLGQGFILGDVGLKAFDNKTISYKGLTVATSMILQAPTSTHSQDLGEVLGLKFTPYVRYSIPGSRFTLGAWTEEKAYLGVNSGKTFKLFGAPYVNYRLTSTVSLNVQFEYEAHHDLGDAGALSFKTYQTDLEPGLVWMITPKIVFNPYVQFFTTNELSADRAALGAVISATLL